MRRGIGDPEQMLPGRIVPGVADEAVDPIESRVPGRREFLALVAFYAVAFGLRSEQVGQSGRVCGVATHASALEDRLMNFPAGDRMADLVVAGHAGFFGAGEHRVGPLG